MSVALVGRGAVRFGNYVNGVIFGKKNLLLTNALVSTAMGALGDSIQQHYDLLCNSREKDHESKKRIVGNQSPEVYNMTRTLHMSCAGLTTGVVTHFWYIFLDKKLGAARAFKPIAKKVFWDQVVFSPINLAVYFTTLGVVEGSSVSRVKDELLEKGLQQIYVAEWFIWPPAQFFNFYCIPLKYRILFDNVISLGFDIYSPYVKYKTELRKEREAKLKLQTPPQPSEIASQSSGD